MEGAVNTMEGSHCRKVLEVNWLGRRRVDWMARVIPLLAGEFNLYEF